MFDLLKVLNYILIESLNAIKEIFDEVKETILPLARSFRKWAQQIEKEVDKDTGSKPKSKSKKKAA
jgi:hypothetical protein